MPSDLHAIYAELCKLGMPEHPRLSWNTCDRDVGPIAELKVAFQQYPQTLCDMERDAPDAAAILDQWAGDWWLGQQDENDHWSIEKTSRDVTCYAKAHDYRYKRAVGVGKSAAEAVLAAMRAGE